MFRDRTNLYLSYRQTIPRSDTNFDFNDEEEGLMGRRRVKYRDDGGAIEMQPIAPSIFDISKDIDVNLSIIKSQTSELNSLYKKLLITSAGDKPEIEKRIENINYEITKKFENSYVLIKKFEFLQKNQQRLNLNYTHTELAMLENFKKNYALKIQDSSLIFRNLQNNYIKFLRDDDYDDLNDTSQITSNTNLLIEEETKDIENYSKQVLQETQQQIQRGNDQYLQQRDREISKLAMGILEISTIFKEMESLVTEQGTILDRIDYNIGNTAQDLKVSNKELLSAKSYQERTTKCKIILLLSLIVFALLMIFLLRPSSSTKIIEKPSDGSIDRPTIEKPEVEKPNDLNDKPEVLAPPAEALGEFLI